MAHIPQSMVMSSQSEEDVQHFINDQQGIFKDLHKVKFVFKAFLFSIASLTGYGWRFVLIHLS
mgnify:CR=1 FL=1